MLCFAIFQSPLKNYKKGLECNIGLWKHLYHATTNIDRMRAIVKKARKDVEKIDNDKVRFIASFPAIKERIDKQCTFPLPL